nr:heavy metal-associated domain-containing protein [Paracoccus sp. (in: a-proteobacteria)]
MTAMPGVTSAQVNLATGSATVRHGPGHRPACAGRYGHRQGLSRASAARSGSASARSWRRRGGVAPQLPDRAGPDPADLCRRDGRTRLSGLSSLAAHDHRPADIVGAGVPADHRRIGRAGADVLSHRLSRAAASRARDEQPGRASRLGCMGLFHRGDLCAGPVASGFRACLFRGRRRHRHAHPAGPSA